MLTQSLHVAWFGDLEPANSEKKKNLKIFTFLFGRLRQKNLLIKVGPGMEEK